MDKTKVYYQTTCGCTYTRDQLARGDNTQNYRLVCPRHRTFIETKFGFCADCGKKISYANPKLAVAKKCETCNPGLTRRKRHRGKAKAKKRLRVERLPNEEIMQSLMDRANCTCRPLCSEMYISKPLLPCHDCIYYEASDPLKDLAYDVDLAEIDAFIRDEDPTTRAEGLATWGKYYEMREKVLSKKSAK